MKSDYARQLPPGWERFSRFFFALGDRTRQQILLVFDPDEEICVNDVAKLFRLSRPAISHHLKVLRDAGLLASEKRGKEVYYRMNFIHCADVLRIVHEFIIERAGNNSSSVQSRLPTALAGPMSWDRGVPTAPSAAIAESDD